jgi:hypothetical protein
MRRFVVLCMMWQVLVMALGGSTNAVLHLLAIARAAGVELTLDDFQVCFLEAASMAPTVTLLLCPLTSSPCSVGCVLTSRVLSRVFYLLCECRSAATACRSSPTSSRAAST